jgi:hypothetical protein
MRARSDPSPIEAMFEPASELKPREGEDLGRWCPLSREPCREDCILRRRADGRCMLERLASLLELKLVPG